MSESTHKFAQWSVVCDVRTKILYVFNQTRTCVEVMPVRGVTTSNESCLRSEDDEQYDSGSELAAEEVGEEAVVRMQRRIVYDAQHVERAAHRGLHHNRET